MAAWHPSIRFTIAMITHAGPGQSFCVGAAPPT